MRSKQPCQLKHAYLGPASDGQGGVGVDAAFVSGVLQAVRADVPKFLMASPRVTGSGRSQQPARRWAANLRHGAGGAGFCLVWVLAALIVLLLWGALHLSTLGPGQRWWPWGLRVPRGAGIWTAQIQSQLCPLRCPTPVGL